MKKHRTVLALVLGSVAVAGVLYGYDRFVQVESNTSILEAPSPSQTSAKALKTAATPMSTEQNALVNQLAIQYLERYGETIHHLATQAKLFDEWKALLASYPEEGQWLFEAAIALAFPDLKDAILSLIQRLALYHQWLEDNYLALQRMHILERQGTIWQKRQDLFGADAEQIWAEEEAAMNQKHVAVQAELQRLDQAFEMTPAEAAFQLQSAVDEIYGEGLGRQLITPDVMATSLFSLDAVQAHLQKLPEEERQPQINALRRQLGYPEDVIAKLEEQDKKRNERWQQGYQYMAEREQLAQQFNGDQLDQKLEALRQKHFGRSAKTIALEEQEGFFRFNRPRRLGLN